MNNLIATVSKIQNCDNLHIVKFDFYSHILTMMSLEISPNLKIGTKVKLLVNPSQVAIAKNFSGDVSYSNKLDTTITSIENGELLSSLRLTLFDSNLESIITVDSSKKMDLNIGDRVTTFIKASDIAIGKICDD